MQDCIKHLHRPVFTCSKFHRHLSASSPTHQSQCRGQTGLVVLIMIAGCTSTKPSGNFLKKNIYYSQVQEGTSQAPGSGQHNEFTGREREGAWIQDSAFLQFLGWSAWSFTVHSLSVNLKYKSRIQGAGRETWVSYLGYAEISKKGNP